MAHSPGPVPPDTAPQDSSPAAQPISAGARSAQARHRHDSGQSRDKIPMDDPAASPLGTDSEAAGSRAGEGSMEPAFPAGGAAPAGHRPAGHARGDSGGEQRAGGAFGWGAVSAILLLLVAAAALVAALL